MALAALLATALPAQERGPFPPEPFNGLQLQYQVRGVRITDSGEEGGDTQLRHLKGYLQANEALRVSGTATGRPPACHEEGQEFFLTLEAEVWVDGEKRRVELPLPRLCAQAASSYPFELSLPVPAGAREGGLRVLATWVNPKFGDRAVALEGSFAGPGGRPLEGKPGGPLVGTTAPSPSRKAAPPAAPKASASAVQPGKATAVPSQPGRSWPLAWILGGAGGLVLGLVLILRRPHRRRGLAPQTLPLLPPTTGRVPSAETHLLEAWFPGGRVLHFVLGPEQDLGRAKGSAIRLDDPSVSARHASLRELPEGFLLEDLGSTNGTWVGGIRLNAPCLLRGEESWSVGDVGLAFRPKKL